MTRPEVVLVVAVAENGVIGSNGQLPWRIPEDLKHFKKVTMGKPVLMGRVTFESIGKPLPGRRNIVLTRNLGWSAPGVEVVHDIEEAYYLTRNDPELMVIGGAQIYELALPKAQRFEITQVGKRVEGDTRLPRPRAVDWRIESETPSYSREEGTPITFLTFRARRKVGRNSYIDFSARNLLHAYASGGHKPGSGSAAALMGLLSSTLLLTVTDLTKERTDKRDLINISEFVDHQVGFRIFRELLDLFERDVKAFDDVFKIRIQRDREADPKKKHTLSSRHLRKLQIATQIPISVADLCVELAKYAIVMYDYGFKGARGDSGAAISAAVSAVETCLFVIQTNLVAGRDGYWTESIRSEVRRIRAILNRLQHEMRSRLDGQPSARTPLIQPDLFRAVAAPTAFDALEGITSAVDYEARLALGQI